MSGLGNAKLYVITRIPKDLNGPNSNQQSKTPREKSKAWLTFIVDYPSSHSSNCHPDVST